MIVRPVINSKTKYVSISGGKPRRAIGNHRFALLRLPLPSGVPCGHLCDHATKEFLIPCIEAWSIFDPDIFTVHSVIAPVSGCINIFDSSFAFCYELLGGTKVVFYGSYLVHWVSDGLDLFLYFRVG